MSTIYLASAYTGHLAECSSAREDIRYAEALYAASILISRSRIVFSPIVLGHTMSRFMRENSLPRPSYEFWMAWSRELLKMCDVVYVLCTPGWRESRGVAQEIEWARAEDTPVIFIDGEANVIEEEME